MSKKKGTPLTDKEKERIALQKQGGQKFISKKKAVEIIKAKRVETSEKVNNQIKETRTIEGLVISQEILEIREIAIRALKKASLKLEEIIDDPMNQYVIVQASKTLLNVVGALTPVATLTREKRTGEYPGAIDLKQTVFVDAKESLKKYLENDTK